MCDTLYLARDKQLGLPIGLYRATLYLLLSACLNALDTTRRLANDPD